MIQNPFGRGPFGNGPSGGNPMNGENPFEDFLKKIKEEGERPVSYTHLTNLRIRKKILDPTMRKRAAMKKA